MKSGSCLIAGFHALTDIHPSYWNAYKAESGATFSIDMVRLKLSFINGKGEWLSTHAQTFDCDSMSAWTSKIRPGGWYELWSFDLGDSSVALGIGFMEPSCKVNMKPMPSEKSRSWTSGRSVFGKKSKRWKPLLQASQKASERSGRLEAMEAEKRSLEARLKALEGELATSQARLRTATAEQKALSEGCQRCEQGIANLQNDLTILEAE